MSNIIQKVLGKDDPATLEAVTIADVRAEIAQALAGGTVLADHVTDNIAAKVIPALSAMLDEKIDRVAGLLAELKALRIGVVG